MIEAMLKRASVGEVTPIAVSSVHRLTVVGRCECGCASVDFDASESVERAAPIADGVGQTPLGGRVGVIVWGRCDTITGLEVYDLGAGDDDLVLPEPQSIVSLDQAGAG